MTIKSTSTVEQKPVGILSPQEVEAGAAADESAARDQIKTAEADRARLSANLDQRQTGIDEAEGKVQGVLDEQTDDARTRASQLHDMEVSQPQDQIGFVMRMSPLFLAMAAIGGGLTKKNSVGALGAMNGMVQGFMKGDRKAYDDAQSQYQQNLSMVQERWKLQDQVYNSMLKAYGNTVNAKQKAYEISLRAIGADDKEIETASKNMYEARQIRQQISKEDEERKSRKEVAQINAQSRKDALAARTGDQGSMTPDTVHDAVIDILSDPGRMRQYASYGERGQSNRNVINNAKASLLKESGLSEQDVVRQQAIAKAQVKSVGELIPMLNAVKAYETVAKGNGERVLELIGKVNTSGVPIINRAEQIGKQATGSDDAAELLQVLQNYQTEVARIIANPRLVGQLTDTARKEIQEVVPSSMTPSQAARIVKRLNVEFELRERGLSESIQSATGSMVPGYGPSDSQPSPAQGMSFATEAEAEAAAKSGKIKAGDKITVGGQSGTWQ